MPGFSGMDFTKALGNTYTGQAKQMLGSARESGILDPLGSTAIRDRLRRRALRNFRSGRSRAGALSQLYGLDPSQSRAALVGQDIAGHGALSSGLQEADLSEMTANRPFYQNLFSGGLDFERQKQLEEMRNKSAERGGFGQIAGSLVGKGIDYFTGRR